MLLSSPNNNNDDPDKKNPSVLLTLRIKSFRDVTIHVAPNATIRDCRDAIRHALELTDDTNTSLRLICHGRLLTPDTARLGDFGTLVRDQTVLHAVVAPKPTNNNNNNNNNNNTPTEEEEDVESPPHERLGFDRLRSDASSRSSNTTTTTGLSRDEIAALRIYFDRHVDRFIQAHPTLITNETDPMRRRLLYEDAWMQLQGPTSEFHLNLNGNHLNNQLHSTTLGTSLRRMITTNNNNNSSSSSGGPSPALPHYIMGTDRDFVWGFVLGFFVGFLMLVWVWVPTVPHKQKLGILTGLSFQLALTLLKGSAGVNQEERDDDDVGGDVVVGWP